MATLSNQQFEISEKKHPLKNRTFFAIPRQISLIPGLTDRLFRLLAILFSTYGNDGHIEFKISTLARLLQKGERQTKDLIDEARKKGWIETRQTGRSLQFFLTEKCFENELKEVRKPAQERCGNPHVSYHLEKKPKKEKEQSNPPPLSGADLVWHLIEPRHRKTIPKVLVNCIGRHVPDKEIPSLIRTAFEKSDPVGYLWGAVKKKQSPDIKKPQSLTEPPSPAIAPAKPQKNMALEEIQQEYKRLDQEAMQNEKNIDEYIKTLSNQEKIDLLFEMKLKFSNFQLKKSGLKFIREIKNPDPFFENRYVRQFVGYENK